MVTPTNNQEKWLKVSQFGVVRMHIENSHVKQVSRKHCIMEWMDLLVCTYLCIDYTDV